MIGAVCAAAAAPVAATIAVGALVGAGIAFGTAAASTYIQDGKVDWETVGICTGVGVAVGALASGVSYKITALIKSKAQIAKAINNISENTKHHILQDKHQWSQLGNNSWKTVSKAIEHTLNKGTVATYKAGNQIVTATYKGKTVQVVVRTMDKVVRIVDAWIKII